MPEHRWSNNCEGKKFLIQQFKLHTETKGKEGINPSLSAKADIKEIYDSFEVFQNYSKNTFPHNFIQTSKGFLIDHQKTGARKAGKIFLIY